MNTERLVWLAISIGVVAGVPLSLLGEILLSNAREGPAWLYVVGLLLAAPSTAYSAVTGNSVFAGTAILLTYFILQIVYCIVMTFFLLLLFQHASRRFVALCAKVKRRINKTIFTFMGGAVFYGFSPQGAHDCSVPPDGLFTGDPNMVWVVDGTDRNATVTIRAWFDSPAHASYDFGFMSGNAYVPVTGKTHNVGAYTFAGGAQVDFALRNIGADGLFETLDDGIYRLSDAASHASQNYFSRLGTASAQNHHGANTYRRLQLNWNLNLDGWPDVRVLLGASTGRDDGMRPATATVPQPAAVWLFASGLLGLVGAARVVTTASARNTSQDNKNLPRTTYIRTIHAVIKHNPETQVSNH